MIKVAVYGTLRQGFHNHYLLAGSKFLGVAEAKFPAVMFSAGGFPKVDITKDMELPPIKVEIYEVSERILQDNLDALEGYPRWYNRSELLFDKGDEEVRAWIYHMETDDRPVVESSDWKEFTQRNRA